MENYYEHIDEYVNNTLDAEAKAEFENEMQQNHSLRLAVENYHDAKAISESLLEVDMMNVLSGLKEEYDQQKTTQNTNNGSEATLRSIQKNEKSDHLEVDNNQKERGSFNIWKVLSAAVFLGIILLTGWWMTQNEYRHLDRDQVLANYIKPVNDDATKSIDTVGMTAFEKGKYFFALNRFEESEKWLKKMVEKESDRELRSEAYYWLGAAHLEQWEVDEAKKAWEKSDEEGARENMGIIE